MEAARSVLRVYSVPNICPNSTHLKREPCTQAEEEVVEAARSVLRVYSQRKRVRVQRYSPRAEGEADALRRLRARHDLARGPLDPWLLMPGLLADLRVLPRSTACMHASSVSCKTSWYAAVLQYAPASSQLEHVLTCVFPC